MGRIWIRLLVVAVLAVVAVALMRRGAPEREPGLDRPLLPGLDTRINALERVRIRSGEGTVTLSRTDARWQVEERAGWPVDTGKLRDFLLRLAAAKRMEAKTSQVENYRRLGVEDIDAEASGVSIEMEGGGEPLALIIGHNRAQGHGSYVRLADDARVWLTDLDLAPERRVTGWLLRDLLDLDPRQLLRIERVSGKSERLRFQRVAINDEHWQMQGLGKGQQPDQLAIEAVAGFPQGLRADDVSKAEAVPADAVRVRFFSADGLVLDVSLWQVEAQAWMQLAASFDAERARDFAQAEFEREQATAAAAKAAEPAAADATAEAPAPPAIDSVEARVRKVQDQVEQINRRVDGWQFAVNTYKADNLRKPRSAFAKVK